MNLENPMNFLHSTTKTWQGRLRNDQFLQVKRRQMICLRADIGTLWVAQDNTPGHIQIDPDENRIFESPDHIIVSTMGGNAVVTVTPSNRQNGPLKIWVHSLTARQEPH